MKGGLYSPYLTCDATMCLQEEEAGMVKELHFIKKANALITMRNIMRLRERLIALEGERNEIRRTLEFIDRSYMVCKRDMKSLRRGNTEVPVDIILRSRMKSLEERKKGKLKELARVEEEMRELRRSIEMLENEEAISKKGY